MSIKSFAIRSARKLLDHLDTEPRLLIIESDDSRCPMHSINHMLRKKFTYRYDALSYGCHAIEAATTVKTDEIAAAIHSWIGNRYDVVLTNGDIKLTPKKTDK
jgi:nickel-dependent lactate racemase